MREFDRVRPASKTEIYMEFGDDYRGLPCDLV